MRETVREIMRTTMRETPSSKQRWLIAASAAFEIGETEGCRERQ